jgi:predicted unusual protein kinase regulating ubiquinone biosynthesis (AarF/ABC1/UbiB family)
MENQLLVRNNMMKSPYRRKVRIPQPYVNLCCKHVLVMEMLDGIKFKDSIQLKLARLAGGDKEGVEKFMAQRQKGKFTGLHQLACPSVGSII